MPVILLDRNLKRFKAGLPLSEVQNYHEATAETQHHVVFSYDSLQTISILAACNSDDKFTDRRTLQYEWSSRHAAAGKGLNA
jgi:hypothetical protein